MERAIEKAETLIEALKYIQSFRGKVVVIKVGGSMLTSPECWDSTLQDIVFLEQVRLCPIIVHGGGPFISEEMKKRNLKPQFHNGLRITDDATLEIVKDVLINTVNRKMVEDIIGLGAQAVGVTPFDNVCVIGKKKIAKEIDLGHIGDVAKIDSGCLKKLLSKEVVPVVSPLGTAPDDDSVLNINADSVACELAKSLKAQKLVFLSDTPGVMSDEADPNSIISTLNESEIRTLIDRNVITGGMIPKITACLDALSSGVGKVHIIDGRIKHSLLLEIFTDKGIGTQIVHASGKE